MTLAVREKKLSEIKDEETAIWFMQHPDFTGSSQLEYYDTETGNTVELPIWYSKADYDFYHANKDRIK